VTASPPPLPDGFTAASDLRGGWRISQAGTYVGTAFPEKAAEPDGRWYARLPGVAAKPCADRESAVCHIIHRLTKDGS
jgi:hypothetical protein